MRDYMRSQLSATLAPTREILLQLRTGMISQLKVQGQDEFVGRMMLATK
jgi:hypothetical protein